MDATDPKVLLQAGMLASILIGFSRGIWNPSRFDWLRLSTGVAIGTALTFLTVAGSPPNWSEPYPFVIVGLPIVAIATFILCSLGYTIGYFSNRIWRSVRKVVLQ